MSFRLSMLTLLSIGLSFTCVHAADDDVVIDGTAQQPVAATNSNIIRTMRDGKLVVLYTPKDRSGEKPALQQQLDVFLKKVDAECALNDGQMLKIELAGKWEIQQITQPQAPIELIEDVLNGKTVLRVADADSRRMRSSTGADFRTTNSLLYKVIQTHLTPEQRQKFEALRDREKNAAIDASRPLQLLQPNRKIN